MSSVILLTWPFVKIRDMLLDPGVYLSVNPYLETHILQNISHKLFCSLKKFPGYFISIVNYFDKAFLQTIICFIAARLQKIIYDDFLSKWKDHFTSSISNSCCKLVFR